jgi:hypothetical protein
VQKGVYLEGTAITTLMDASHRILHGCNGPGIRSFVPDCVLWALTQEIPVTSESALTHGDSLADCVPSTQGPMYMDRRSPIRCTGDKYPCPFQGEKLSDAMVV